jgi:hypothetical protein
MTGLVWRLAAEGSKERAQFHEQRRANLNIDAVKGVLEGWREATDGQLDSSSMPFPNVEAMQPIEMVRMRALVLLLITELDEIEDPAKVMEVIRLYGMSPHVASPTEAVLLARERVTRGVSAEERAHALWNHELTFLVAALQLEPGLQASRIQMALLTLFHERRMVARDMAAQVPGVVTASLVAGTVFHLAIANGHTAFLKSVLSPPFNLDPDRLPPFLGAHSPLCWAAMTDQVEALEVLL